MLGFNSSTWKTHHFCSCFIGKACHMVMSDINGMVLYILYSSSEECRIFITVMWSITMTTVESSYVSLTGLKNY